MAYDAEAFELLKSGRWQIDGLRIFSTLTNKELKIGRPSTPVAFRIGPDLRWTTAARLLYMHYVGKLPEADWTVYVQTTDNPITAASFQCLPFEKAHAKSLEKTSKLSPEMVTSLREEFNQKPFNISERAKLLGISRVGLSKAIKGEHYANLEVKCTVKARTRTFDGYYAHLSLEEQRLLLFRKIVLENASIPLLERQFSMKRESFVAFCSELAVVRLDDKNLEINITDVD